MKKVFILLLSVLMITGLSAGNVTVFAQENDTSLSDIIEAGVVRVGISGGYHPVQFHDPETDELVGYEVEMIKEVFADIDPEIEIQFEEMSYTAVLDALRTNRVDIGMHNFSPTPEREASFDFTTPYLDNVWTVIVHEDSDIQTLADLEDKRAAQSLVTSTGRRAEELGATIVPIETIAEAVDLILQDRADFYLGGDVGQISFLERQEEPLPVRMLEESLTEGPVALAVRPGSDELRRALDEAIIENSQDETLKEIYERYVGIDKTMPMYYEEDYTYEFVPSEDLD